MQTTEIYTRANPSVKLETGIVVPPNSFRRFKATDKLIASLKRATYAEQKKIKITHRCGSSETNSA